MRKLWVKAWITLDGVFDAGTMGHWWQNTSMDYITALYAQGDIHMMGRVTYEVLWPEPLLNRMQKVVISTTLTEVPWKETIIIRDNVLEEIAKLKQQSGKDIIIDGSATLVQSLQGTGLIDEYRFLVEPFIMGRGRRFFEEAMAMQKLRLIESKTLPSGTLVLIYQPVES